MDENRQAEARQGFDEALAIYRKLAQGDPAVYLVSVADTLAGLGMLHARDLQYEKASVALEEALDIYRPFAKTAPQIQTNIGRLEKILASLAKATK